LFDESEIILEFISVNFIVESSNFFLISDVFFCASSIFLEKLKPFSFSDWISFERYFILF